MRDSVRNPDLVAIAFDSPEVEERRRATSLLAYLDRSTALPLLFRALGDEDWRVRKEATNSARAMLDDAALLDGLVAALGPGDNVGLRNAAVDVLAGAGAASTERLGNALSVLDADGRKLAVEALGRTRDPSALFVLERQLSDGDANVRQATVEGLGVLAPVVAERALPMLLGLLHDGDRCVALAALEGLRTLGATVPWERLSPLLDEPSLRSTALAVAASSDSPEATAALVGALAESRGSAFEHLLDVVLRMSEGPLRPHVAEALSRAPGDLGSRLVTLASTTEEAAGTRSAALVLAGLARASGITAAAMNALSQERLADAAERALLLVGASALPAILEQLGGESNVAPESRAELVELAESIATDAGTPANAAASVRAALRACVVDADRRVAASAILALARIGVADDLEVLATQTSAEARSVSHAAETALERMAARFPLEARAFVERSREAAPLATATLVGALAAEGRTTDVDLAWLAGAATTGDSSARRAAVVAIAAIGGHQAMDALRLALADEERDVQLAAARALGRLCVVGAARPTLDEPSSSRRPAVILELIERSGAIELLAAAVRAIGDALAAPGGAAPRDLLLALAGFIRTGQTAVALAAIDALGQAPDEPAVLDALAGAVEHSLEDVARAGLLRVATRSRAEDRILDALRHPAAGVRLLAAELLAERGRPDQRERIAERSAVEPDRDVRRALEAAIVATRRAHGRR